MVHNPWYIITFDAKTKETSGKVKVKQKKTRTMQNCLVVSKEIL